MDEGFFDVTTSSIKESEESASEEGLGSRPPAQPRLATKSPKAGKSYNAYATQLALLYHPDLELPDLAVHVGAHIEVRLERCYLSPQNKNVRRRRLFGTEDYTSHSDVAAMLLHAGLVREETLRKSFEVLGVVLKVSQHKRVYPGSLQHGLLSRALVNAQNNPSFKGQTVRPVAVKHFQGRAELYKLCQRARLPLQPRPRRAPQRREVRAQERFGELVFNMNHELALKYSLTNVCDKSPRPADFLSQLLGTHLLVLETREGEKFALRATPGAEPAQEQTFELYRVGAPAEYDNARAGRDPLGSLELLAEEWLWSDLVWAAEQVELKGFVIEGPTSFKFYKV